MPGEAGVSVAAPMPLPCTLLCTHKLGAASTRRVQHLNILLDTLKLVTGALGVPAARSRVIARHGQHAAVAHAYGRPQLRTRVHEALKNTTFYK